MFGNAVKRFAPAGIRLSTETQSRPCANGVKKSFFVGKAVHLPLSGRQLVADHPGWSLSVQRLRLATFATFAPFALFARLDRMGLRDEPETPVVRTNGTTSKPPLLKGPPNLFRLMLTECRYGPPMSAVCLDADFCCVDKKPPLLQRKPNHRSLCDANHVPRPNGWWRSVCWNCAQLQVVRPCGESLKPYRPTA